MKETIHVGVPLDTPIYYYLQLVTHSDAQNQESERQGKGRLGHLEAPIIASYKVGHPK